MTESQYWLLSDRGEPQANRIAKRHYNCQSPTSSQFMPPGACVVLKTYDDSAVWGCSWPKPEYTKHAWAGAWINTIFRNEGKILSSDLIREAVAVTRHLFEIEYAPLLGIVTFVDIGKVRRKRDPGRCYRKAGFRLAQCPLHLSIEEDCAACHHRTEGGLLALQMKGAEMPEPMLPLMLQNRLFA